MSLTKNAQLVTRTRNLLSAHVWVKSTTSSNGLLQNGLSVRMTWYINKSPFVSPILKQAIIFFILFGAGALKMEVRTCIVGRCNRRRDFRFWKCQPGRICAWTWWTWIRPSRAYYAWTWSPRTWCSSCPCYSTDCSRWGRMKKKRDKTWGGGLTLNVLRKLIDIRTESRLACVPVGRDERARLPFCRKAVFRRRGGPCCLTDSPRFFLDGSTGVGEGWGRWRRWWTTCCGFADGPPFRNRMRSAWTTWNGDRRWGGGIDFIVYDETHLINPHLPTLIETVTYLRPDSKCCLRKSLKWSMCCSRNSTWFAIFCRIFDTWMSPLLTCEDGWCSIIPVSNGDTA